MSLLRETSGNYENLVDSDAKISILRDIAGSCYVCLFVFSFFGGNFVFRSWNSIQGVSSRASGILWDFKVVEIFQSGTTYSEIWFVERETQSCRVCRPSNNLEIEQSGLMLIYVHFPRG